MKIVTWNANCRFREKWEAIAELGADVYVIQECENPQTCKGVSGGYREFTERSLWWGERDFKGLGVFAAPGVSLVENQWEAGGHRVFGCVRVNGVLDLLAVWTKPMGSGSYAAYVRQFLSYHALNAHRFSPDMVVMGDFNSNTQWDGRRWKDTHRDIVQALAQHGLVSAYHHVSGEEPGQESEPSFYQARRADKAYHIDYAFTAPARIRSCGFDNSRDWLALSDHRPLVLELE